MSKLNQIIADLVAEAQLLQPPLRPMPAFLLWCGIAFAASLLIFSFSSPRADLAAQLRSPLFLAETVNLLLLILSAALVAVWLCFPDMRQNRRIIYLPLPFLVIYAALETYRALHPGLTAILPEDAHNDFSCALCITLYSLVPGFWMFRTLKRHATTQPRLAGAISLLTAASIGLLMLKFTESNDSIAHLALWHLIPVALLGMIGTFLGEKYLNW